MDFTVNLETKSEVAVFYVDPVATVAIGGDEGESPSHDCLARKE